VDGDGDEDGAVAADKHWGAASLAAHILLQSQLSQLGPAAQLIPALAAQSCHCLMERLVQLEFTTTARLACSHSTLALTWGNMWPA